MSIIGKFLKIAGKDPNGNAKGVAVTENGEVKVQQTGSIVEKHYIFENLAIADTQSYTGTNIDVSNYTRLKILAKTTLDQPVYLGLRLQTIEEGSGGLAYYDGSTWGGGFTRPNPSTNQPIIEYSPFYEWFDLNTYWEFLNDFKFKGLFTIYARCQAAPTTGELTVIMYGGVD